MKTWAQIFFLNSGRARVNRAGRKPVRAGRSALRNRPSWDTATIHAFYLSPNRNMCTNTYVLIIANITSKLVT